MTTIARVGDLDAGDGGGIGWRSRCPCRCSPGIGLDGRTRDRAREGRVSDRVVRRRNLVRGIVPTADVVALIVDDGLFARIPEVIRHGIGEPGICGRTAVGTVETEVVHDHGTFGHISRRNIRVVRVAIGIDAKDRAGGIVGRVDAVDLICAAVALRLGLVRPARQVIARVGIGDRVIEATPGRHRVGDDGRRAGLCAGICDVGTNSWTVTSNGPLAKSSGVEPLIVIAHDVPEQTNAAESPAGSVVVGSSTRSVVVMPLGSGPKLSTIDMGSAKVVLAAPMSGIPVLGAATPIV